MIASPRRLTGVIAVAALAGGLALGTAPASASPAGTAATAVSAPTLTNLAHLDFLLDTATVSEVEGHSTYMIDSNPQITMPWTYADARDGGTFERVGGGPFDPATGHWGQGAYNTDDISRAAVVYVRDWQQTGSTSSRDSAYELLRALAYFQTLTGPNAGNVILWMQPDGTFNASPEPLELPSPSDSGESYWLARSLWAFGEGFAAFEETDPAFAAFLQDRLQLGVEAVERQALTKYGEYAIADGVKVPAWLIVDGADATAEAVLGLAAYSEAVPDDAAARSALTKLAEGVAQMGSGDTETWPYGAVLPWAQSQSLWHAWASQMPAALAAASVTLGREDLLEPAVIDSVGFTTTLLTAGGPDNGWLPTPSDTVQIAYGADSRLQSLLAVADATGSTGFTELAGMMGSWFFGMNKAGEPVYNPATGVTYDGVQPDGGINRNSGAESTIHGLLAMMALDAHPDVAARALAATDVTTRDGLTTIQGESATSTNGTVVTPESAWTGESLFHDGAYLQLTKGQTATFQVPASAGPATLEPVVFEPADDRARSKWSAAGRTLGVLKHEVGDQGITAVPGALLPQPLKRDLPGTPTEVTVDAKKGTVKLDALISRPLASRLVLAGDTARTELVHSATDRDQKVTIGAAGVASTVHVYDHTGVLVRDLAVTGVTKVTLPAGGFAVATR